MVLPCLKCGVGFVVSRPRRAVFGVWQFLFCDLVVLPLSIGTVVTVECVHACIQTHRACMCMHTYWVLRRP